MKLVNHAHRGSSTETATRWRATLSNFPRLATSSRDGATLSPTLFSRSRGGVHTGQQSRSSRSGSCAGKRWIRRRTAQCRSAEGARTLPDQVRADESLPSTRPRSAPPPPLRPAPPRPQEHCLACREGKQSFLMNHLIAFLITHSLGSKFPTRRPHPIFDVLSPHPASRPHFPRSTSQCALRTPPVPTRAVQHPPFSLLGGVHLHPDPECGPFYPRAPRTSPHHLPSIPEPPEHPESQFKLRTPGTKRRARYQAALDSQKCGTYCLLLGLLLGPPLGRASGGRWPLRGAGAGGPQS